MITLLAAGLCLLAVGGVSCGGGSREISSVAVDSLARADTLALVEGLRLYEEGQYGLAREHLLESSLSGSTYIRAESFLYLNALEMELGNYATARPYLERYHTEAMQLLRRVADSEGQMTQQVARLDRRHKLLIGTVIGVGMLMIGALLFLSERRQRFWAKQNEPVPPSPDISHWKPYLIDAEIFKQTAIYAEIVELAQQPANRSARVLTVTRQQVLDQELAAVFADFAARLRTDFPSLTTGDVKLCCLSLLPLSSFSRALCFGSTETNIIKQRKHQIKKKLAATQGHELFEFIFSNC